MVFAAELSRQLGRMDDRLVDRHRTISPRSGSARLSGQLGQSQRGDEHRQEGARCGRGSSSLRRCRPVLPSRQRGELVAAWESGFLTCTYQDISNSPSRCYCSSPALDRGDRNRIPGRSGGHPGPGAASGKVRIADVPPDQEQSAGPAPGQNSLAILSGRLLRRAGMVGLVTDAPASRM